MFSGSSGHTGRVRVTAVHMMSRVWLISPVQAPTCNSAVYPVVALCPLIGAITINKANITFRNLAMFKTRKTSGQAIPFFQGQLPASLSSRGRDMFAGMARRCRTQADSCCGSNGCELFL